MKLSDLPPELQKSVRGQIVRQPRRRKSEAEKALARAEATKARDRFFAALRYAGVPLPEYEVRFHPTRRWRFDYAWVDQRCALEVNGGLYVIGHHSRGASVEDDYEKLNHAAARGWRVLQVTPRKLAKPTTVSLIKLALDYQP